MEAKGLVIELMPLDISETFQGQILLEWKTCADQIAEEIAGGRFDRTLIEPLMDEADLWASRSRALTGGELRVFRFYASRG